MARRASIFGRRLSGLSRLKERASPSWSRMNISERSTVFRIASCGSTKLVQAMLWVSTSYSHRPTIRPLSEDGVVREVHEVADLDEALFAPYLLRTVPFVEVHREIASVQEDRV